MTAKNLCRRIYIFYAYIRNTICMGASYQNKVVLDRINSINHDFELLCDTVGLYLEF